ncbi:cytochrome P450 [Streptomyces himalayensis]|uniref:Cytochrome P450 n=1 Tax=Streptomyces himalayensis subsp. himalayensis TaxID=2756131 RepID=A0A7W0I8K2_9ACTN|nr:cytochrome P450 [Streptomyces himalayensis]MBA2946397.1 cytochrome P450 [Streptomyces himalayensis subsp. himalayensis]
MTTPSHSHRGADEPISPPPGCPAHGLGPGGLRRLYGSEAESDLAGIYEKLRAEHGSVAPVLVHDDVPMWAVIGHTETLHMLRTRSHFTRDSRRMRVVQDGTFAPDNPLAPMVTWAPLISFAEGAEHQRVRGAINDALATIDDRGLRRFIHRSSQRLVNEFCEKGTADLVSQFAEHLPMAVMCEVLGMPDEYNERLVQAGRDMTKGTATAVESNEYVMSVLYRHTTRRRAQPEEDFTSRLIAHPAKLTDDEVAQNLRVVLIAAYEGTANLMANVLRMVLTDPRFRAQLNGGQMTVPEAIEQSLWDEPPMNAQVGYVATEDAELGGQRIKAGDGIMYVIAAGNVDPVIRPDLKASMAGNRAHLAFGGGPHECPGQDIARSIADVGVDALLMRLPDAELAVDEKELRWRQTLIARHLVDLPVMFTPRPPQDVKLRPTMGRVPSPRKEWEVSSPPPRPQATSPAAAVPAQASAAERSDQPLAAPPPSLTGEGEPPKGALQRLLRWWRGY